MRKSLQTLLSGMLLCCTIFVYAAEKPGEPLQSESLINIIRDLNRRYNVHFTYDREIVENVKIKKRYKPESYANVNDALSQILRETNLRFQVLDTKYVVIYRDDQKGMESLQRMITVLQEIIDQKKTEPLLPAPKNSGISRLESLPAANIRIDRSVKGRVLDEKGEGLPGVNVIIKGTQQGTVTNAEGHFELSIPNDNTALIFSFVGYLSAETVVGSRTSIDISLKTDEKALEEVVVVGYGTQRKKETTGSIASVKADELLQTPISNVAQGLQARVAGVQVSQNSGAPGGNISVRIRGTNSINGTTEPLFVIDGIQIANGGDMNNMSPLSQINPNDIESLEILKDASATAIYGARAANGVVLITTKRGKEGATRVTYDGYYGVQQINKLLPVMNGVEFAKLENEVYNRLMYPNPDEFGEGTNWQSLIFRDAPIQSHQFTVSGGNSKTQLLVSGNYFNQQGIIVNSGFTRYSFRINLDHQLNDRFKIGSSLLYSVSTNNNVRNAPQSPETATGGILNAALTAPPILAPYLADGSIFPFQDQFNGTYREVTNPLGFTARLDRQTVRRSLLNLYGEANLAPGLSYRATFTGDLGNGLRDYYSPRSILSVSELASGGGQAEKGNSYAQTLLHESILTYRRTISAKHTIGFTGVFATQTTINESNQIIARNFPNDNTINNAIQLGNDRTISSYKSKERLDSYMGRINYGFSDRYFVDITARLDGSSKFGTNYKWGFFPAISAAWRVIEEDFLKTQSAITDLKIRGSWGRTGNAGAIGPYESLATVGTGETYNLDHNFVVGIQPEGIPNPDLRWEKSTQIDVGADVSLFKNRINIVTDYYHKLTSDLLFVKQIPMSSGYANITGNYAKIQNKGFELAINAKALDGKFNWDVSGNFSVNRNKLLELDGKTQEIARSNYSVIRVGEPLGIFKTYVYEGIYQTGDAILPGSDGRLGGHKIKDLNNDGTISAADQIITGNANPNFIYGFTSNWKYKGFDLSAFLQGVQGGHLFSLLRLNLENPLGQRNLFEQMINRWSPTNPSNEYASGFQGGRHPYSDRFIEDGSFMRIKNITLGYTLPQIKGLYSARIYISTNNPVTFTKYSGYDPEVNIYPNSTTLLGIDNGVFPIAKSYLAGLQISL